MDLIYADGERKDIGILKDYTFDLAYGVNENDFSLTLELNQHCCEDDYIIYMVDTKDGIEEATEYGGIIDDIQPNTAAGTVTYSGRTWHGIMGHKIIQPDPGQDYKVVTGDAHTIMRKLIAEADLSDMFRVEDGNSEITVMQYSFDRYTDLYTGITKMLSEFKGKLLTRYEDKMVVLTAVWLVDYSQDDEWDSSQVDFKVSKNYNPVNHLVCLGHGELKDRHVIHLFTDDHGGVQPYATVAEPYRDEHYILDKRNQRLFHEREVSEVYDNASAAITENYIRMSAQPSDWWKNYGAYFEAEADGKYSEVEGQEVTSLTLLASQPGDWSTRYSNYFTADGKSVQGVQSENYVALTEKPADWETKYNSYYVHFWDGVQYQWQSVSGVSGNDYVVQTQEPSDWKANFGAYYKLETKYKEKKDKNGKVIKDKNGKPKRIKIGVGYVSVTKVKSGNKEVRPTWKPNYYFTSYPWTVAPDYNSGLLPKYRKDTATVAPTWAANTYYTKTTAIVAPPWKNNHYYQMFLDHYAELVRYGIARINDRLKGSEKIDINLDLLGEYDVGDIVGANENVTGVAVWQPITKKIIKIQNNQKTITYQIGEVR